MRSLQRLPSLPSSSRTRSAPQCPAQRTGGPQGPDRRRSRPRAGAGRRSDEALAAAADENARLESEAEDEREAGRSGPHRGRGAGRPAWRGRRAARAAAEALSALRATRAAAEHEAREAEARVARLQQQLADVDAELAALAARMAGDTQVASRQAELMAAQQRAGEAETRTLAAEERNRGALAALEAARPPLSDCETALGRLEAKRRRSTASSAPAAAACGRRSSTRSRCRRLRDGARRRAWRRSRSLLRCRGAAALGRSRATAAPILPCPRAPCRSPQFVSGAALLGRRLDQIGLVAAEDGPRLVPLLRPGQRLVTREGDLWRWDGFVAAADAPSAAAQRLAQRNRLAELDAEIAAMTGAARRPAQRADGTFRGARCRPGGRTDGADAIGARPSAPSPRHRPASMRRKRALGDLTRRQSALAEARERLASDLGEARTQTEAARAALSSTDAESEAADHVAAREAELAEPRDPGRAGAAAPWRLRGRGAAALRAAQADCRRRCQLARGGATGALDQGEMLAQREAELVGELAALESGAGQLRPAARGARRPDRDGRAAHRTASDRLAEADTAWRDADRAQRLAHDALAAAREELARIEERIKGLIAQRHQIERQVRRNPLHSGDQDRRGRRDSGPRRRCRRGRRSNGRSNG